jgi:sporulation protein YlmC with PRC-barrel domain
LEKLDPFIKTKFIQEKVPARNFEYNRGSKGMGMGMGSNYYLPYVSADRIVYESVKEQQIPPGELAVRRGTRVEATDGYVGKVDEFVVNPENGHITHLVMREGHLWGKKDVIIPISAMGDTHEDTVFLKLNKHQIESLPTFPLHRRWS